MAGTTTRRPLPALVFLLGLLVLTSIVWWRVLHRNDTSAASAPPTCVSASANVVPQPSSVTVHVLNSTDRAGLARATGDALIKIGFNVPDVGNDTTVTTPLADVGEIRYGPGALAQAKLVSFYLTGAKLVQTSQSGTDVTISLGTTFTAVSTPAAAEAAMQSAHVTQSAAAAPSATASPTTGTPRSTAARSPSASC